jgi:hypothetical protein
MSAKRGECFIVHLTEFRLSEGMNGDVLTDTYTSG